MSAKWKWGQALRLTSSFLQPQPGLAEHLDARGRIAGEMVVDITEHLHFLLPKEFDRLRPVPDHVCSIRCDATLISRP